MLQVVNFGVWSKPLTFRSTTPFEVSTLAQTLVQWSASLMLCFQPSWRAARSCLPLSRTELS